MVYPEPFQLVCVEAMPFLSYVLAVSSEDAEWLQYLFASQAAVSLSVCKVLLGFAFLTDGL